MRSRKLPARLIDRSRIVLSAASGKQNKQIAVEHAEVVAELKAYCEAWFEDVRSTRNFTPGVIHLGNSAEKCGLAEGHLNRCLFGEMQGRIWTLPVPGG